MPKRDGARAVGFDALVRQRYVKLSPAHRRIADYLLADGRRAALVPAGTFDAAVEAILGARRTYVVGSRGSAGLALVLGMGLRIFLPETRVIAVNVGDEAEELLAVRKGDLVIVISVLRYSGQTL